MIVRKFQLTRMSANRKWQFALLFACINAASAFAESLTVGCPTAGISEFRELAAFAKSIGATHVDACQIEHSLWQWNADRNDPYPNWSMHRPSVFKFVVPPELEAYLPSDYAARNLKALQARAAILRELGLKADFTGMEPAYLPEKAYLDHPAWRGARCDQARRARTEYYAPCVENPEIRKMYVEATAALCRACPFDRFKFRCNDSGSAICWSERLYAGQNGPEACRGIPYGKRVADVLSIFQEGAAKAGLPGAKVDFRAHFGPEEPILPCLKPGQSVNNKTAQGTAAFYAVGFPNRFTDATAPVLAMTRLPRLVEQLQTAQRHPGADVEIGLRSTTELCAVELLRRHMAHPVGRGPVAKWSAVREIAAVFVGEEHASELAEGYEALEAAVSKTESFYTGGHFLLLGSLHQRWFIRPFVAFPGELEGEDRRYWREFIFQAQDEDSANNLLDLQGHRWLSGYGGERLIDMSIAKGALPLAEKALGIFERAGDWAVDDRARAYLAAQRDKIEMYVCLLKNARNAVEFQSILDRTDFSAAPRDTSPAIDEQGDVRLHKLNLIVRAEIDNTLRMIGILERAGEPVFEHAATDEGQTIMRLGPKASVIRDLRRRIAIMEAHRRDFLRLYRSYNK